MTHSASSIPDNPQGKPYVDFLVLLPLEDELLEFTRHFPSVNNVSTEIAWRHFVDPGDTGYRILAAQCISSGRIQAVNALQDAYLKYDIGVVVCIGIAGGLSTDLRLGDVCYTGTVTDVFDNAKASDDLWKGLPLPLSRLYFLRINSSVSPLISFVLSQKYPNGIMTGKH